MKRLYLLTICLQLLLYSGCKSKNQITVVETMKSGGYIYLLVKENNQQYWVASTSAQVAVGDNVEFSKSMPMKNFKSTSLNRTFDLIYFTEKVTLKGSNSSSNSMDPAKHSKPITPPVEVGVIKKAAGGYTIKEIYSGKPRLDGKLVKVRGKIIKVSKNILGKNWIHIQDGSGGQNTNDLLVTSKESPEVGQLVLVSGKAGYDKNFGSGYSYSVIIEEGKFLTEK